MTFAYFWTENEVLVKIDSKTAKVRLKPESGRNEDRKKQLNRRNCLLPQIFVKSLNQMAKSIFYVLKWEV